MLREHGRDGRGPCDRLPGLGLTRRRRVLLVCGTIAVGMASNGVPEPDSWWSPLVIGTLVLAGLFLIVR